MRSNSILLGTSDGRNHRTTRGRCSRPGVPQATRVQSGSVALFVPSTFLYKVITRCIHDAIIGLTLGSVTDLAISVIVGVILSNRPRYDNVILPHDNLLHVE